MPGPKMGERPHDFDEEVIKQSPTFLKWASLPDGAKLKYACREFVKGNGDDEERMMRRIMIARRNNLKDHDKLKKARQITAAAAAPANKKRKVGVSSGLTDNQLAKEMDMAAVEGTRSYKMWMDLDEGAEFVYNQKYMKGRDGHDWLLKKNIWRRMRYRRDNKKLVTSAMKGDSEEMAAGIVDHVLEVKPPEFNQQVVDAAVAAAEQYVKTEVHNQLEDEATDAALDAAAKLAAGALSEEGLAEEETPMAMV
jgi:hypothetical protein